MVIKRVQLPTADPLTLAQEDYELGEVTILYLRRRSERWLLMGVVELLPAYMEPRCTVPSEKDASCTKLPGGEFELNLRRSGVAVSRALDWYKVARAAAGSVEMLEAAGGHNEGPQPAYDARRTL